MEKNYISSNKERLNEEFIIQIMKPMLYDRLHTLSAEYSVSVDFLVNVAIEHLIDDVDFIRNLRIKNSILWVFIICKIGKHGA